MANLLADENLPFPAVMALRNLGHDIQTLADLGLAGSGSPVDLVARIHAVLADVDLTSQLLRVQRKAQ